MGCDMVVALGRVAVDGHTLFGHNSSSPVAEGLRLTPGRCHVHDEKVSTKLVELAQAQHTYTVLGSQPAGTWGYSHGANEYGVAAGCGAIRTKLSSPGRGLLGSDLVRLALERCRTARQAADLVTDLIIRYGQSCSKDDSAGASFDHAFLIADPDEAFVVECAGSHWVGQQVLDVRALSDECSIRQDWDRIATGLAHHAISAGWWPDDGSKLDFAASVCTNLPRPSDGQQRWKQCTHLLEQQNGRIDVGFVRRLLGYHHEGCEDELDGRRETASMVVRLHHSPDRLPLAWCAFGPPSVSIYFPVFLDSELPAPLSQNVWQHENRLVASLGADAKGWRTVQDALESLQGQFDQEAEEFAVEKVALKREGEWTELRRQIGLFMEHILERFDATVASLQLPIRIPQARVGEIANW